MPVDVGRAVGYLDLDTSGFTRGFTSALQNLRIFSDSSATVTSKLDALSGAFTSAGRSMTMGLTLPIVAAGTAMVKTASDFEAAMSKTMAVTDTSVYGYAETYRMLSEAAQEMGATTRYSASEAADGLYYMSLAGWDANEAVAALPGVLALAASSAMDLGDASDLVTDYLTAFGESADYAMNMADMLAYAQANSNTTTQLLGDAFGNCATQAHAFGATMSETTSYLSALANSGLKGSEAGTALSAVFRDITQKMENGSIAIGDTTVAVQDAAGNFRSLSDILRDVTAATEGMGSAEKAAALMNTFTARSIKAVNILLNEGSDSLDRFNNELLESSGAAAAQSEEMLNNLSGQLTILKSALEGLAISFGNLLLPTIKKVTQAIQNIVAWINNLSDSQKQTIVTILEIVAAIGPVLLIIGKVIGLVSGVIKVVKMVKTAVLALNTVLAANPIVLVIGAIVALVAALVVLYNKNEQFRNFVNSAWAAIKATVVSVATAIANFFTTTIPAALEAAKAKVQQFVSAVVNFFTVTVPNAVQAVGEFFQELPSKIAYALGYALGTIASWVVNAYNTMVEAVPRIIDAVVQFFQELPGKLAALLTAAVNSIKTFVTNAASTAKRVGTEVVGKITTFFSELPGKISGFMTSALTTIKAWGTSIKSWATSTLPEVVSKILSFFQELPGNLVSIGSNIVKGLWNGIKSSASWLWDSIKSFCADIIAGFKAGFSIASPSKKMIEQGKYLMLGLAKGIEDYTSAVLDPIDNLTKSVLSEVQDGLSMSASTTLGYSGGRGSSGYSGQQVGGAGNVNNFNFYSPKALDPIQAAKTLRQTSQQLALGL